MPEGPYIAKGLFAKINVGGVLTATPLRRRTEAAA